MNHSYPLMLDLTGRLVVIVGGGGVAARKAAGVMAAGATRVRVVAPELTGEMPKGVTHVAEAYDPRHLDGAGLVFAATDRPEVNAAVVRDARAAGVLVNRADSDEVDPGDFAVPAMLRRSSVTITVSSSGAAPALSARMRDEVGRLLDDRWVRLADAAATLRPLILSRVSGASRRREALQELASDEAVQHAGNGHASLKDWLAARYPELAS
ncbi:MAG TPA: NAD(P)-dependent oxidoreductase [Tepidisphaeraceae bacterium]|nr:NAD(P)-dependent oxidoreductase [Tepidisphaeraceae bacterium]